MKFSMTGQEKDYLLIQVTAWAGLSVYLLHMVLFVGDFRQVVSSTNKTVHQDITEILLEVVLNITTL